MLRTIIIEDEIHVLNMMTYFINDNEQYNLIATFSNPLEALKQAPLLNADVLFIDIEMPGMNGIELAKKLKTEDNQIVFTTAYAQYAIDAFRIQATDYLLKPVTPEAITSITERLKKTKEVNRLMTTIQKKATYPLIQCFGTFKVMNKEQKLLKWPTRKTEELFAYMLTYQHQVINKWVIADAIWPDKDGEKGIHNVHNTVYLLKKILKEYGFPVAVNTVHDGYILQFEKPLFVDFYVFQQLDENTELMDYVLEVVNQYSNVGPLFADKDYHWSVLLKEQLEVKHKAFLRKLYAHYEEDSELAMTMKNTYSRLYETEISEVITKSYR